MEACFNFKELVLKFSAKEGDEIRAGFFNYFSAYF